MISQNCSRSSGLKKKLVIDNGRIQRSRFDSILGGCSSVLHLFQRRKYRNEICFGGSLPISNLAKIQIKKSEKHGRRK